MMAKVSNFTETTYYSKRIERKCLWIKEIYINMDSDNYRINKSAIIVIVSGDDNTIKLYTVIGTFNIEYPHNATERIINKSYQVIFYLDYSLDLICNGK